MRYQVGDVVTRRYAGKQGRPTGNGEVEIVETKDNGQTKYQVFWRKDQSRTWVSGSRICLLWRKSVGQTNE